MVRLPQELDRIGEEKSIVIAVGYMLRYSSAIEVARELLQQVGDSPPSYGDTAVFYTVQTRPPSPSDTYLSISWRQQSLAAQNRGKHRHPGHRPARSAAEEHGQLPLVWTLSHGCLQGMAACMWRRWAAHQRPSWGATAARPLLITMRMQYADTCTHMMHAILFVSSVRNHPSLPQSRYDTIASPQWWDTLKSGGCIVGQATHFVDAMRHLARSEIERGSIRVVSVGPGMPLLNVAPPPAAEHTVWPRPFWASSLYSELQS